MKPPFSRTLQRLALMAAAGGMLSRAQAQEGSGLPPGLESILGITSGRPGQIREIAAQAELSGEWRQGMSALAAVARVSKEAGDRASWVEAELAWVKLASREGGEPDLEEALEELVSRARDWGLAQQEADVFACWAARLESSGQWLAALRAWDGAAQATMGAGKVREAIRSLLEMSRLCRDHAHPWRLQQVWVRIRQAETEFAASLDDATRRAIEQERDGARPLLEALPPLPAAAPQVDLQPAQTAVRVSRPHREVGRTRFFLTNETPYTVQGKLEVTAAGSLRKWETGRAGHWLTFGEKPPVPVPGTQSLSLRPGEQVSVYMEVEPPAAAGSISLHWSGAGETSAAAGFTFAPGQPETSFVNAGQVIFRPGRGVPFYHELNYRGGGVKVEDFQFQSSIPCRLEIFEVDSSQHPLVDTGSLLAVDAEGDGYFTGPGDTVASDHNGNGTPDVLIGDRSRSLEIFAWPLVPLPAGTEFTVSASLRRPGSSGDWAPSVEDVMRLPDPPPPTAER